MKIIGVIPARYKSTRFPGKPLADICGKPMVWWVYQQCLKVPELDEVYVATDDVRIFSKCEEYDINVIMTSDKHQTGTDRVSEVAEKVVGDFFVNIQGDEPLIEPEVIQHVIDYYKRNQDVMVINTMSEVDDNSNLKSDSVVKVAFNDRNEVVFLSRSIVPFCKENKKIQYYRHMGLYGLTKEALSFFAQTPRGIIEQTEDIEMFRFIENNISIKILPIRTRSIAVDLSEDINKVELEVKLREVNSNE